MQLERLLHSQGFGSRKECRALIRSGYVSVAGTLCDNPNADFDTGTTDGSPGLEFDVDGKPWHYRAQAYLMLHKPAGYECSHKPTFHPSIFRLLPVPLLNRDVQCVGRLDQDATGLLLLSDDGQFIHQWSSGKKRTPKVYEITLADPIDDAVVQRLRDGVQLDDEPAPIAAVACALTSPTALRLTIAEGKYHQVKRMIGAVGNRVVALHRSTVGGLTLDPELEPGAWRWLEPADFVALSSFD